MFNYRNILTVALVFTFISCNDNFLDRNPYNSISSTNAYASDANATMSINGIYKALNADYALGGLGYYYSRCGPDGLDFMRDGAIEQGLTTSRYSLYLNAYSAFYRVINYANDAVANLTDNNDVSTELASRLLGEAKFMRAISYFYLWQLYGGVILLDKPVLPEETYLPRNSADEIRDFIIADLLDVIDRLPLTYSDNDYGRITQGAARALLGKVYVVAEQWEQASDQLSQLLQNPYTYELHPEYSQLFDHKWEKNNEVVFSLQMIMEPGMGSQYDFWYGGRSAYSYAGTYTTASSTAISWYENQDGSSVDWSSMPQLDDYNNDDIELGKALIPWYEETFSQVDKRLHANVIMPGSLFLGTGPMEYKYYWPYNPYINANPPAFRSTFQDRALYPWRKFVNTAHENLIRRDSPNDIPIIRFAEVLLLFAEARNAYTGPDEAVLAAVNQVRARAGLQNLPNGLNKLDMQQAIRLERLREFPGEGHIFFDVKRWRTAHTSDPTFGMNQDVLDFRGIKLFTRVFKERDYLWPIPAQERELNPNLEQNPGWD